MGGNFAGILAPIATGVIAQTTGSFTGAFVLAAALSVVGIVSWSLVLGPVETLVWRRSEAALQPLAAARLG